MSNKEQDFCDLVSCQGVTLSFNRIMGNLPEDFELGFPDASTRTSVVELFLSNLPFSLLYDAENETLLKGKEVLSALHSFRQNAWPLEGCRLYPEYEGRFFSDLDKYEQLHYGYVRVHLYTLSVYSADAFVPASEETKSRHETRKENLISMLSEISYV